jgi:Holliday junction DNA helicase RuvB
MNQFRPAKLSEIIGNTQVVSNLKINCEVSRIKGECIPHLLIDGPPGTGKSSIALAVANELHTKCYCTNGANIKSPQYILPVLMKLKKGDILFIDEIHRLKVNVEEFLYIPMEDFKVYISSKTDSTTIQLPEFTLIGATTTAGSISKPLRDRFPLFETLNLYSEADLCKIIQTNAHKLNLTFLPDGLQLLARCSRGTPRVALSLLKWTNTVRIAENYRSPCDHDFVLHCLHKRGVDEDGLNELDRRYIDYLQKSNDAVGIETIAAYLQVDRRTLEETVEPYLLQKGLILKTKKGRIYKI